MCGIVGIFDRTGQRPVDAALLKRMNDAIAHRGPDGEGFHNEPGIGLGHRRLAIIDVGSGQQPIYNETGDVGIVFNGEIYNYAEIARELTAAGHVFRTRSDTEVIVHAWEQWGEACLARLRGMFAFLLWDRRRGVLFAARDRTGEKPLYYASLADGHVVFASELKALLAHPDLDRRLDVRAIEEFFAFGYVPDPRTVYAGIRKLEAGCMLVIARGDRGEPEPRRYWDPVFAPDPRTDERAAIERMDRELLEAVRLQLVSEVPLGAFLSGGVDSSAVVAMMAQLDARPVETFSIGFRQKEYDESEHAAAVAARFGTSHHARIVDADAFDLIDRLGEIYDEPFGDASAIPTLQVCATAREKVTVALSGDGGDEVFCGYRRYLWHAREERIRALLPRRLRRSVFGTLAALYPKADWAPRPLRAKTTFQELALDPLEAYFVNVSVVGDAMREALFSPRLKRELDGHHALSVLARHAVDAPKHDPLVWAQYLDLKTWLPGDILTKVDRAAMAVGLETRAPFLDHRLIEWAGTLPAELKLRGTDGKWVLKQALQRRLPKEILYRRKQGFSVPLTRWFRGPLKERVRAALLGGALADSRFFDLGTVARLLDQHQSGVSDHARPLWLLLMFETFLRREAGARLNEFAAASAGPGG
jgi:asparagine synthase (glutamine-hydrolysing)